MELSDNLLEPLNKEMRCGIFTNANGRIVIIHDQKIKKNLEWVEYDGMMQEMHLIYDDGTMQNLGISMPNGMLAKLSQGDLVYLLHLVGGEIQSSQEVVFLWREK